MRRPNIFVWFVRRYTNPVKDARKKKGRLSRIDWLRQALDAMVAGDGGFRIDQIAALLGVSRGSFYWHFEGRRDFVHALAEYWRDEYTNRIVDELRASDLSGEEKLRTLIAGIFREGLGSYDFVVRAWARDEPDAREVVREVDRIRFEFLLSVFRQIGLREPEASTRAWVFVVHHTFESTYDADRDKRLRNLDTLFDFFVGDRPRES